MTANTAIILIDVYNDFLHPDGLLTGGLADTLQSTDTIKHLNEVVKEARARKIPIYYGLHQQHKAGFLAGWKHTTRIQETQRNTECFKEGAFGSEIYKGLEPDLNNGDVVIAKHWSMSSFSNTDLDYQLRQRDITNLVFAGLTANACIEATARFAYEFGYHVTMLKDATAAWTKAELDAATELSWPGFAQEVMTTAEWIAKQAK